MKWFDKYKVGDLVEVSHYRGWRPGRVYHKTKSGLPQVTWKPLESRSPDRHETIRFARDIRPRPITRDSP